MPLIKQYDSELRVVSKSMMGCALMGRERTKQKVDLDRLTLIIDNAAPVGVLVPYKVWCQIQHFVVSVIERQVTQ